jgi:hypothetical protein
MENPRQQDCVAGVEENLELNRTRQAQITSARDAASSGNNGTWPSERS